jgi:pimeloyl-ACP methyl ester carboxylesterase
MVSAMKAAGPESLVEIPLDGVVHLGNLAVPANALGLVLFAHGSGSSRLSPRNRYVAGVLQQHRLGTLLFDLLTAREDEVYATRFDIELLTCRLLEAARWAQAEPALRSLPLGFFGASTGAAAALRAAARLGGPVRAVVSRGGRPDLAMEELPQVTAPTLLIVGGYDDAVIGMNRAAYANLACVRQLKIIPGATHLFEEPGTLEQAALAAAGWFVRYLSAGSSPD